LWKFVYKKKFHQHAIVTGDLCFREVIEVYFIFCSVKINGQRLSLLIVITHK
jgi:hypothetical protein